MALLWTYVVLIAAAVVAVATPACASLHVYKDQVLSADLMVYRKSGMYALVDTPATRRNYADAHIKLDLTFERRDTNALEADASVQVTLFHEANYDKLGYQPASGPRLYCCTDALKLQGVCEDPNKLIIGEDLAGTTEVLTYTFDKSTPRVTAVQTMSIKRKGVYYLLFSSCNKATGDVLINGHTKWMNPYGMLPGELYGFLPFYGRMALAYLFVSFLWAAMCSRHWRSLIMLQNCLTGALVLAMLEVSCRYLDLHTLNETGLRSSGITLFGLLFSALKQAMARALILAISMGYGVVRPTLGDLKQNVLTLVAAYVFFALLQSMLGHVNHSNASPSAMVSVAQYAMVIPKAAIDVVFCFWTYSSLQTTVNQVTMREQSSKLSQYERFQKLLLVTIVMSVAWALYYMFAIHTNMMEVEWESRWTLEAFWDLIYFFGLVVIMAMWRPAHINDRFTYHQIGSMDQCDDEYGEELEDPANFTKPANALAIGSHSNNAVVPDSSSASPLYGKHD